MRFLSYEFSMRLQRLFSKATARNSLVTVPRWSTEDMPRVRQQDAYYLINILFSPER